MESSKREFAELISEASVEKVLDCIEISNQPDVIFSLNINRVQHALNVPTIYPDDIIETFLPSDNIKMIKKQNGYINVYLNNVNLMNEILTQIAVQGNQYGNTNKGKGKTIVVEYSSPNIAKPFHVGHLRSTIIGNILSNLFGIDLRLFQLKQPQIE